MHRYPAARITIVVLLYSGLALDPPSTYVKHYAACHAVDGSGRESSAIGTIPDLRSKPIRRLSDDELFNAIARGDVHKSYAHSFLNQGVSEAELQAIAKYVQAIQKRPTDVVYAKTSSSR